MILETLGNQSCDWIEWLDASGVQGGAPRPLSPQQMSIKLNKLHPRLKLVHKPSASALWFHVPEEAGNPLGSSAGNLQKYSPVTLPVELKGELRDPAGDILPRLFTLSAGNRKGLKVGLFRSPKGTRFGQGGGLYGTLCREDGQAVPWGVLRLSVTPPLSPALKFLAQADAHGEFRLALDRLPALPRDAHFPTYPATLDVLADLQASAEQSVDPDGLSSVQLCTGTDGGRQFGATLAFALVPGAVASVCSPGQKTLVLKSS